MVWLFSGLWIKFCLEGFKICVCVVYYRIDIGVYGEMCLKVLCGGVLLDCCDLWE